MKNKPFEASELFLSLEGESVETGRATVYFRTTKCNFECRGFNNPSCSDTTSHSVLKFNPNDYQKLSEMPPISVGCDSQYSWNPEFSHTWTSYTAEELAVALTDLCPHKSWIHPITNMPVILSITGGEPMLRQKHLPDLLFHHLMKDCKHVLIETNASVPMRSDFLVSVREWLKADPERKWTWACSPKLSASGEPRHKAVRPDVVKLMELDGVRCNRYFKFVCGPNSEHFDEVQSVLDEYRSAGCVIPPETIEIMPEACTGQQQRDIAVQVADMCMERGFKFCFRLQNSLYENAIGK